MHKPDEDLKATAESIRHDAERIVALEQEKLSLDAGDPRVDALSIEVERITARLKDKAAAEQDLAEEIKPR